MKQSGQIALTPFPYTDLSVLRLSRLAVLDGHFMETSTL